MDIAQAARAHLQLQNTIHWIKSIAIDQDSAGAAALQKDLAVGHYKPINSPRFLNDCHEFVFHFTPAGRTPLDRRSIGVQYQDPSNIARWRTGGANRRCRGNAWFIPYDTIKFRDRDRPHPATFPPRLAEYCLRLHGLERITRAMDPFLGLGSSAVAAARLDVDFLGVEIDEQYLAAGIQRVNDELNERGLFEVAGRAAPDETGQAPEGLSPRRESNPASVATVIAARRAVLAGGAPLCQLRLATHRRTPSQSSPAAGIRASRSPRLPTATRCGSRRRSRASPSSACSTSIRRRSARRHGAIRRAASCSGSRRRGPCCVSRPSRCGSTPSAGCWVTPSAETVSTSTVSSSAGTGGALRDLAERRPVRRLSRRGDRSAGRRTGHLEPSAPLTELPFEYRLRIDGDDAVPAGGRLSHPALRCRARLPAGARQQPRLLQQRRRRGLGRLPRVSARGRPLRGGVLFSRAVAAARRPAGSEETVNYSWLAAFRWKSAPAGSLPAKAESPADGCSKPFSPLRFSPYKEKRPGPLNGTRAFVRCAAGGI